MIGNQIFINGLIKDDERNPVKEGIDKLKPEDIIYMITEEYWKQWRRDLTHSDKPYIYAPGLGSFNLRHGKAKNYLRKTLKRIRRSKDKAKSDYTQEGTKANGMYNNSIERFQETWKQVDQLKREIHDTNEIWKQKKIKKWGDKAII